MCSSAAMSPLNLSEVHRQFYDMLSITFAHLGIYPPTLLSPHSFAHSSSYLLIYVYITAIATHCLLCARIKVRGSEGHCSSGAVLHSSSGVLVHPCSRRLWKADIVYR